MNSKVDLDGPGGELAPLVLSGLFDDVASLDAREFLPFRPGVEISPVYGMDAGGQPLSPLRPAAAFLRYEPGASVPVHRHNGYEHIIVLRGNQKDANGEYTRGMSLISPPGSLHSVSSPLGCLVLALWNLPVTILEEETR